MKMSGQGDCARNLASAAGQEPLPKTQLLPGTSSEQNQVIVASVLKHLTPNELKVAAQVCPLWQDVILRSVGVPLFIGNRSRCWAPSAVFEHPTIAGRIATPVLTISDLTHPVEQLCPVKYPEVVKTLLLDGSITPANFSLVIGNPANILTNLTNFAIDWTTMSSLSLKGLALTFPSLKTLRLWSLQVQDAAIDSTKDWTLALENMIILLQQAKYPKLKKLFLTFLPVPTGQDAAPTVLAVVNCISAHKATLRKLLLDFIGIEAENKNLNAIAQAALGNPALLQSCSGLSLTRGMLRCDQDVHGNPAFGILNHIITQSVPTQEADRRVGLESVYLDTGLYPTAIDLQNHQPTLTSIEMDISLSDGAIDCFAFHGCSQLKVLTLIGRRRRITRSDEMNPEILETPQLPSSLESLRLIRLRINTANADFLITRTAAPGYPLSKLKLVELQDIGQYEGLGLSLQALDQAWQNLTLHKLSICKAVNLENLEQPTPVQYSMGIMMVKQSLQLDSDYAFGIYLTHAQNGQPCYEMGWGEPVDEGSFWKFTGTDPKLYFPSTPFDLKALNDSNDHYVEEMEDSDGGLQAEDFEEAEEEEDEEAEEEQDIDEEEDADDAEDDMDFEEDQEDEEGNDDDEDWDEPQ